MTRIDTTGLRRLADELAAIRERLVPDGATLPGAVSEIAELDDACRELQEATDAARVGQARQVDALWSGSASAAARWEAAEEGVAGAL
ncbi:hypothetical protein [Nakamurella endophytica]|nr:hypothetical protein [Nakamurella endophytica]